MALLILCISAARQLFHTLFDRCLFVRDMRKSDRKLDLIQRILDISRGDIRRSFRSEPETEHGKAVNSRISRKSPEHPFMSPG